MKRPYYSIGFVSRFRMLEMQWAGVILNNADIAPGWAVESAQSIMADLYQTKRGHVLRYPDDFRKLFGTPYRLNDVVSVNGEEIAWRVTK